MADVINVLVRADASRIEKFAAEELAAYTGAMTDKRIKVVNGTSGSAIYVGSLPDRIPSNERARMIDELNTLHRDGFIIRSMGNDLVIQGRTPRATLYGVYSYLQTQGVRWYFPGKENEFVPKRTEVNLRGIDIKESPDMNHRSVVIYFRGSAFEDWIEFAARAKLNAIHLHSDEGIHQMSDLLATRGLDFGLRRHFFGEKYPPDVERDRTLLLDYIRGLPPQLNEFFLWQADAPLELRDTGRLSLSDAVLMFTNEMLGAIRTIKPAARMSFLAYWSTWHAPRTVRPAEGVFLELAHIHQCFSHSIADPACPVNSEEVLPVIEELLQIFDPAESHVLGYWLDASLFGRGVYKALSGRLPWIGEFIRQDIKFYKSKGVPNISTFAVGLDREYFSRFASPSVFQYPALLWSVETDLESELVNFCENLYGDRSLIEVFKMGERIDPGDNSPDNWKSLVEHYSHAKLIVKEILQKASDDAYIHRLGRLIRELEHTGSWIQGNL